MYQFTLDDHIAYLTEFIRKDSQPPPLGPALNVIAPTLHLPTNSDAGTSIIVTKDSRDPDTTLDHVSTVHKKPVHTDMQRTIGQLPKLSLPTFSGDPLQWQMFWDSFDAAVHSNVSLSGVQKFNYLAWGCCSHCCWVSPNQ